MHGGLTEPSGSQKGPDREGAMTSIKGPRKNLKQQRRHEQEVVPAYENDLDVRPALEKFFQAARGVDPAEAAAQNHDPSFRSDGGLRRDVWEPLGAIPPPTGADCFAAPRLSSVIVECLMRTPVESQTSAVVMA